MDSLERSFNISGLSVAVAIPSYRGIVPLDLASALVNSFGLLYKDGVSTALLTERENAIVSNARNRLVHDFLTRTTFQKLLFIDDDIIYKHEMLERLICWSTKYKIVCGTYPTRQLPLKFFIRGNLKEPEFNEDGLLRIHGTGLGFTIIDRSVFESMHVPEYDIKGEIIKEFFRTEVKEGKLYGEDMLFFGDCIANGFDVWLDLMIKIGHWGNYVYEANVIDLLFGDKK